MNENINLPELPPKRCLLVAPAIFCHDDQSMEDYARAAVLADRAQRQEPAWWAAALNRRATVEQWMFDAARGKRPMPTAQELREWAIKLGTPVEGEPVQRQAVPQGWTIERQDTGPFKRIFVRAPNGYVAVVESHARNPENILYLLADALLSASPTPPASESNTSGNCLMGCAAFQRGESHCDRVCLDAASEPVQDAASVEGLVELAWDFRLADESEVFQIEGAIRAYAQRLKEGK